MAKKKKEIDTYVVVDVRPPRCPKCKSTERGEAYHDVTTREQMGRTPDGEQYTHIKIRRTRCKCGQYRIERTYENRTATKPVRRGKSGKNQPAANPAAS